MVLCETGSYSVTYTVGNGAGRNGGFTRSGLEYSMQVRKLAGAALLSHLAKARGEKLPLRGAALINHLAARPGGRGRVEMMGVVGILARLDEEFPVDEPMKIGEQVVEQFPEVAELDGRVPWDGEFAADEFITSEGLNDPSSADVARIQAVAADHRRILRERFERKEARRVRKAKGRDKVERELWKLERQLEDADTAAQFAVRAALAHHEHTKQELAHCRRLLARHIAAKPLQGDPANIPAARKWVEDNYPERMAQ